MQPFRIADIDDTQAPLLEHLVELRGRLLRAFLAFAVAFAVCFYFSGDIFSFLVRPLTEAFPPGQGRLIYTKLYEAFFVEVKIAMFAAFFVSFPVIANQIWAFIAPGLYAKEKRAFLPFLIATPVLFTMGAALAYYVVMPTAFHFFLGFEGQKGGLKLEALPGTGDYLALVMQFILAGIVTRQQCVAARRYAIVGVFIVAAVATPPDVISQLLLAIPLLMLFEGTLILMWFTERRDAKDRAAEEKAIEAEAKAAGHAAAE
jgi:sec-independent protein translocase protein TatC